MASGVGASRKLGVCLKELDFDNASTAGDCVFMLVELAQAGRVETWTEDHGALRTLNGVPKGEGIRGLDRGLGPSPAHRLTGTQAHLHVYDKASRVKKRANMTHGYFGVALTSVARVAVSQPCMWPTRAPRN